MSHSCLITVGHGVPEMFLQCVHSSVPEENELIWGQCCSSTGMSQLPDGHLFTTSASSGTILEGEQALISDLKLQQRNSFMEFSLVCLLFLQHFSLV